MKSVGEAMAIGRNFTEALQKALRSLEQKGSQLDVRAGRARRRAIPELLAEAKLATDRAAHRWCSARCSGGATVEQVFEATGSTRGSSTSSR